MNFKNQDQNTAYTFASIKARAEEGAAEIAESEVWHNVKNVATAGLYVGVFLGTVLVVKGAAKAVNNSLFGK